jgi:hypothetical protein
VHHSCKYRAAVVCCSCDESVLQCYILLLCLFVALTFVLHCASGGNDEWNRDVLQPAVQGVLPEEPFPWPSDLVDLDPTLSV